MSEGGGGSVMGMLFSHMQVMQRDSEKFPGMTLVNTVPQKGENRHSYHSLNLSGHRSLCDHL